MFVCVCVFFLAVYNKAQAQGISNREFKLWTFLRGTESRVATFLAETCVMSHHAVPVSNDEHNTSYVDDISPPGVVSVLLSPSSHVIAVSMTISVVM